MAQRARIVERQAAKFERKVVAAFTAGRQISSDRAVEEWKESCIAKGSPSAITLEHYCIAVRAFLRHARLLNEPPCTITEEHVCAWVNLADGTKAGTRLNRLAALKKFLSYCEAKALSIGNPARVVDTVDLSKLTHEQKEPKRKVPFTDEEVQKILTYLDERIAIEQEETQLQLRDGGSRGYCLTKRIRKLKFWKAAVIIGRFTGLRIADVAQIEKASFGEQWLVVHTGKTDARVELPMNDQLRAVFKEHVNETLYLFPAQRLTSLGSGRATLCTQFSLILEGCGIDGKSYHCLRSTFSIDAVARLITAGKTREEAVAIVAKLVGHSNTKTTEEHYI